eukprot:COSAG06_NODE_1723_length_8586_cov_69.274420_4_plen_96_part_00
MIGFIYKWRKTKGTRVHLLYQALLDTAKHSARAKPAVNIRVLPRRRDETVQEDRRDRTPHRKGHEDHRLAIVPARKRRSLFECSPYVCPEPVLVK